MKTHANIIRLLATLAIAFLAMIASVHAQVTPGGNLGDSATFIAELNAGENLIAGADPATDGPDLIHDWDTSGEGNAGFGPGGFAGLTDPTYQLVGGTDIRLSSGRHLVLYNSQFNSTGAAGTGPRTEMISQLNLAGGDLAIGHSQGYLRRAGGADELITTGAAIITVASDDDTLNLVSFRSDSGTNTTNRINNASSIQLLKLDDAWDYLSVEQAVDGAASVGTAGVDVSYDTINANTGSAFSFTAGTSDIVLEQTGLYLVTANTGIEKPNNGTRTAYNQVLTLAGSPIAGTRVSTYMRGNANGEGANSGVTSIAAVINNDTPGQALNVNLVMEAGGSAGTVTGGRTAVSIVKLPVSADYISLLRTETQNINVGPTAGVNPINWDTTVASSATFSHPGTFSDTVSAIETNLDGEYLFLGSLFHSSDGTNDNTDRVVIQHGFSVNTSGTAIFGRGAEYNRDNGGNRTAGSFGAALLDLAGDDGGFEGDEVEFLLTPLGNTDPTQTSELAITGLRLGSLFPSNDPVVSTNSQLALTVNEAATIDDSVLSTSDLDSTAAQLTYTLDTVPAGGTLFLNAVALGATDTFTQADVNAGLVTFTAGGTETDPDSFDFTVADQDGGPTASDTFSIRIIQAIVVAGDSGSTDEDTVTGDVSGTNTVLANDTGNSLTVTSFDALSAFGAAVNVNADGTFTYDPTASATLQALGIGDNLNDTFSYTVTDTIGKTDTTTVTIAVSGVEDAIGAVADVLDGPLEDQVLNSTANLVANDGPQGTNLPLNYDARNESASGLWENTGSDNDPESDWALTGVDKVAVTSTRAQITSAYEWDSTLDDVTFVGNVDVNGATSTAVDTGDATWEWWLKPGAGWDTTVFTIFETGGGTGFGAVIDQGTFVAATELDGPGGGGSTVSYDLQADPLSLVGGDPSTEFNQYVVAIRPGGGGLSLYINGTLVDESTGGTNADWSGGDAAGLGHASGDNHGGFQNGYAGTRYDAKYIGQMAIVRLYSEDIGAGGVLGNFNAVSAGTDTEGDTLAVTGLFDGTINVVGLSTQVTLPSGALVTITSATGDFTYDPNGAFDSLQAGETAADSFTYQVTDSGSDGTAQEQNASAAVTLTVHGTNQAGPSSVAALEGVMTVIPASDVLRNTDHGLGVPNPYINLDTRNTGDPWVNSANGVASGGTRFDQEPLIGSAVVDGDSNFGALGNVWGPITANDLTIERDNDDMAFIIWAKPDFGGSSGQEIIFESGGGGNGMVIFYDRATTEFVMRHDGGADGDPNTQLETRVVAAALGDWNQIAVIYDRDNPGLTDSISMYVNADPTTPFDGTATVDNSATAANELSGGDNLSIGADLNAVALDASESYTTFNGCIGIIRVYDRLLTVSDIEADYDAVLQPIASITAATLSGATATLQADGSVKYDATGVSIAADTPDVITFTVSDGEGGTTQSTLTVNVINQGGVIATSDDTAMVFEGDIATSFNPLGNDIGSGLSILFQENVENSSAVEVISSISGGLNHGDLGDVASTLGWRFLWNAPTDWVDGTADTTTFTWSGSTGPLDSPADWDLLVWDSTVNGFLVDGDGVGGPDLGSEPGAYLRISPGGGGHTGYGSTQTGSVGNTQDRYVILEWDVTETGFYGIANSSLTSVNAGSNGHEVAVVIDGAVTTLALVPGGGTASFDAELGEITAGSKLAIAIGPNGSRASDTFSNLAFDIVKLPSAQATLINSAGLFSVSADGKNIIYDPNGQFMALATGQTTTETITYTVTDGVDVSTASFTVTIKGENDNPIAVADAFTTDENTVATGDLFVNDSDPDQGDFLGLSVAAVDGQPGEVGVPHATLGGATVTVLSDGTYTYDPGTAFDALSLEDTAIDAFTYVVQDTGGLQSDTVTVTVTITANDDGVTANDDSYTVGNTDATIMGNIVLGDALGGVADINVDDGSAPGAQLGLTDTLSVVSGDFATTLGTFELVTGVAKQIGVFGTSADVDSTGVLIDYGGGITNPVFIFGPPSDNDTEPSIVQFEVFNATSFVLSIKEQLEGGAFSDGDGATHPKETVSWAVLEAGQYQLSNGALMEVGTISTSAIRQPGGPAGGSSWQAVSFNTVFNTAPAVITSLQTFDSDLPGADAELFGTRINSNSITTTGFQVALEDVQGGPNGRIAPETIGYIAIEPGFGAIEGTPFEVGVTTQSVGDEYFTVNFS
ncbi:MAG: hypothetical protein HKO57_06525, partial [Akkermansiaceae bacterium]|nr:hypothetical protein [Akkermansiaceae bacterium]